MAINKMGMSMKTKILSLLRNTTEYISGQELCEKLGVSRTAIWKVINQLKEEGYVIEAIQNKGYKIQEYPDILTKSEIASRLNTEWAGRELYYYAEIDSTNIEAKKKAEEGASHGTLIVADKQTAGRGRRGRSWEAPAGSNIYMTIMLKPDFEPNKASMLTIVMALAAAKAIQEVSTRTCAIKWPNDIVVNGRKICGILTEMSAELDYIQHVVIGIGINVNQKIIPEELASNATSLYLEGGEKLIRAHLIERSMYYFEHYYDIFVKTKDLSGLAEEYDSFLINRGKAVRVLDPKGEFEGIASGINELGELRVTKDDGTEVLVYAGEVSVRGLYGYV